MDKNTAKYFLLWLFWLFITVTISLGFIVEFWEKTVADITKITQVILCLFLIAIGINIWNTFVIYLQFKYLNNSSTNNVNSLFCQHINNLKQSIEHKISINQDISLNLIENRLLRQEGWVQLFANLMITLGMIGTILGLTASMNGLSRAMDSFNDNLDAIGNSNHSISGLSDALSGMSSAFVTTLAGAVFGGVLLKLLSHSTTNLIEDFIDNMKHKTEIEVLPELQKQIWQKEIKRLSEAQKSLLSFINSAEEIESTLQRYTSSMYEAAEQMNSVVLKILDNKESALKNTRNLEKTVNNLNQTIKELLNKTFIPLMSLLGVLVIGLLYLFARI